MLCLNHYGNSHGGAHPFPCRIRDSLQACLVCRSSVHRHNLVAKNGLLPILPHQLFFLQTFSNEIELVSKNFTSKKGGPECPPHAKLLACGFVFCDDWALTPSLQELIFVVSQEAMTSIFFCRIARMQATSIVMTMRIICFHVVSQ
jgi:hypothetical protein